MLVTSNWRALSALVAIAGTLSACGGTSDSERVGGPSGMEAPSPLDFTDCESIQQLGYDFQLLDGLNELTVATGTEGNLGWYISDDGTNPNRLPIPAELINTRPGGADSLVADCEPSARALRLLSEPPGFGIWGYAFGANVNPVAQDASAWDGLAFWARRGEDTSALSMGATLVDQYTSTISGEFCAESLDTTQNCDPFGRGVGLDADWRFVLLPFDEVFQGGFGKPTEAPDGMFDEAGILQVQFAMGLGAWEVWFDELMYYRAPAED